MNQDATFPRSHVSEITVVLSEFPRNVTLLPVGVGEGEEKSSSCLIYRNIPCEFWAHARISDAKNTHISLKGDGCTQENYPPNLPTPRRREESMLAFVYSSPIS